MAPSTFTAALLRLWIVGRAVRPGREDIQQLLETEVAPADVLSTGEASTWLFDPEPGLRETAPPEAGAVLLEGESANYPHCEGLPRNGSHVIDEALILSSSCTWQGHSGLQVRLKEPLTFQGNLVLMGEIQIIGEQERDGACMNVRGRMTVTAARASFVGCRNRLKEGKGGALFIEHDFITDNSDVKFESCAAKQGGGLYAKGGYHQDAGSSVLFQNCSADGGEGDGVGGGARVENSFTQGPNSSAIFRGCKAGYRGGGLFSDGGYQQEAGSSVLFEHCSADHGEGGGARLGQNFTQGPNSSAIFRGCKAGNHGGGLYAKGGYQQEAGSSVLFEHCSAQSDGGGACVKNFRQGPNTSAIFCSCRTRKFGGGLAASNYQQETGSSVLFENCSAEAHQSDGGGASVENSFTQGPNGTAVFRGCRARRDGGGLYAKGGYQQEAGSSVLFEHCSANGHGGGASVENSFTQGPNSTAVFRGCRVRRDGGGLYANGGYQQDAGSSVRFQNCSADDGPGGAAFVVENFTQGPNSSAMFRSCRAAHHGGGLYAEGGYRQEAGSSVLFENCSANSGDGGGVRLGQNFTQGLDTSAIFRSCRAGHLGGGLNASGGYQQEAGSSVFFEHCSAKRDGGGARVKNFTQGPNTSAIFRSCRAGEDGGGLFADGGYQQEAGSSVFFEHCSAKGAGGGARLGQNFTQGPNTSAIFRSCRGGEVGGGLAASNYQQETGSSVLFENCSAEAHQSWGGGARVENFFKQGPNSTAIFRSCRAEDGGGLHASGSYQQQAGSSVLFEHCSADDRDGGGALVENFTQGPNTSAIFRTCRAGRDGGGLHAKGGYQQEAGTSVLFEHCSAKGDGGGARLNQTFTQGPNSSAIFRSCRAGQDGGGLDASNYQQETGSSVLFENCSAETHQSWGGGGASVENFTQHPNSSAIFRSCRAGLDGGGLHASGSYQQEVGSSVLFEHCSADRDGGGVITEHLDGKGSMHFKACRAHAGGGLRITQAGTVHHGGSLAFEACHASSIGGGLYLKEAQGQFAKLLLHACDADVSAAAFAAVAADGTEAEVEIEELSLLRESKGDVNDFAVSGLLKIGSAHLRTESSESSGIYISARNLSLEELMNCTSTSSCTFYANATATRSAGFLCPLGTGAVDFQALQDFGCLACKPGDTQVLNVTRRPCSQCPEGAFKCLARELKMEPGLMVELEDVNRSFHCPNEAACPGGDVSQGRVRKAMCQDGYRGQGCTSCREEYAIADSSVFSCTACSKDRRVQAVQWITFLSQRAFLFALGALSALGAKNAGDLKQSSIYLNQLMAFATISNTILAAVLQTKTAKGIKNEAANFFFSAAAHTAEAASGQGSLRSASSQCLLSYVGYEKTLWGTHLLDVVVAAGLVSLLSLVKDFRAGLIAGMNCFLPTIAADFGKYLVCYRLQRDDATGFQGLHCPFLPSAGLAGTTQVVGGLTLFMTAALWTWLSLSRSDEDPKPSHVVFLTSKYQRRYALFETERLIRKTLFTFIGALLPIASSPALQMGCLGIVVLVALFLYCRYKPYHSSEWNWIEICLLFAAMVMITSVSTLLANEFHWGHSVPTQQSIIFATAGIAAVASAIMAFRVIQELVREQRQAAK